MSKELNIRMASIDDAPALWEIYVPYVHTMAVTFEIVAPTVEEYRVRVANVLQRYPFLVAEREGEIVGFAYASAFRPRLGYIHSIETSIYMRMDSRGGGAGKRLYETLGKLLVLQNVYNMNACIAHSDVDDERVPATSRLFHERCGFELVGKFSKCARKFNTWYDMIWMEKVLADHPDRPEPFVPFPEVDQAKVAEILAEA